MTATFNYDPYYDDFDEDKNFMRVLFRPGYSVQARELTQLQTILANQIEKFGNHIFKSGSPIVGGKVSLDNRANYIVLQAQYSNSDIDATLFLDKTIVSYNSSKLVKAKVIAIDITGDNPVLIIKYLSGERFVASDEIKVYGQEIFAQLKTSLAVGGSYVAKLQEGVFYFKGQFVKVIPQYLVLEVFYRIGENSIVVNANPSYKIGIEFTETIVDEIDDTSLLDPAQGAFNYQAPGAERFSIETSLSKRTLDSADISTFFEIVRLVDGVKTKEVEYPIYSELEKTLARRTFDESGNYTVDPFVITLDEGDSANGKFSVILDPGKAYISGYEFETIAPTTISVDRAREVSNVSDYDLPTNYESTIVLANVRNTLDITAFPQLDIHAVPWEYINITTAPKYNSTKIGTIFADMIRYNDSATSANGNTHTFTVHVFGANTIPITGTLAATTHTATQITLPTTFNTTLPANTYSNSYFQITNGAGASLSPILITTSNNTTLNLTSALTFIPASNTFTITSDIKNAESLVANGGLYIASAGNIDADSKESDTGFVYISNPNKTSLILDTPYEAIKANTLSDMDFFARKKYSGTTAGGLFSVTASGTDTFSFSPGSGTISSSLLLNNIICFVRSDSASDSLYGITPNTILALSNTNFTITSVSTTQFQVNLQTAATVKVDLLVTTKINNAEDGSTGVTKRKQLIPITGGIDLHSLIPNEMNSGGTQGTDTLYSANTTGEVVSGSFGSVFKSIGAINYDNTTVLTTLRTPGTVVSLQVPDVYEIIGIFDSKNTGSNVTSAMLTSSNHDITTHYEFDNGQRKTHYDHGTIKLKRGYSAPTGKVFVQFRYFKNLSGTGLFTVDSYSKGSNISYDEVSKFENKEDKKLISLRSAFDFRPSMAIGGTTLSGALNPEPLENITLNYDYFLPRIDQVIVKSSRQFTVLKGQSALVPIAPPVNAGDMLIYTLYIPAYTENVKDIRANFKNHRRFTMSDIQKFDDRIRGLEYYVALTTLEKDAAATKILDANGLERSKYGILVDNFTNRDSQATFSDVDFDNRNLIDSGKLYPASLMRTVKLEANTSVQSGATKTVGTGTKKAIMLSYTTKEFAKQPYATKSVLVADSIFANFKGVTKLFPEFTGDVDTGVTAKVTLNSTQGIDNAFNFINGAFKYIADSNKQWADDKNSPFAQIADSQWYKTRTENSGAAYQAVLSGNGGPGSTIGILQARNDNTYLTAGAQLSQKQITTSTSQVDVGTFITDLAIQPYMKSRGILFASYGLRPSTIMYSFFDSVEVNRHIVVPNKVTLNANTTLISGESVLTANTIADLTANLVSLLSGGSSYDLAYVTTSEVGSANVSIVNETAKPLISKFVYGLDSGKYFTISTVTDHRSGVTRNITSSSITLASDAPAYNISGNVISLIRSSTSLDGIGASFNVINYNTTTKVATISGASTYAGTTCTYSFGTNKTNKIGQVGGMFYMRPATYRSGERNFRLTESFNNSFNPDSISFADKGYNASGLLASKTTLVDTVLSVDINSQIVGSQTADRLLGSSAAGTVTLSSWGVPFPPPPPPPPPPIPIFPVQPPVVNFMEQWEGGSSQQGNDGNGNSIDPLAQTFFVDASVYPYGLFLSSVDVYFKAKEDGELPVWIQIRPTVNGFPSSDFWYPESVVTKYSSEVNTSESPSVTNSSTATNFEFSFPVYLKPGLYAFVVLSDSPEYIVWEAEKGATTTNNEFVDKQPYMGTLYKSQNSMEWSPFINEDLMFRLNRCVFTKDTTATYYLRNEALDSSINFDKLRLIQNSIVPYDKITDLTYSLATTTVSDNKEASYRKISPNQIYSYSVDDLYSIGFRRKKMENQNDLTLKVEMSTTNDAVSPIFSMESAFVNVWENFVDNAEINSEDFTIIAPGQGYSNANSITITSSTGSGANANVTVDANGNVIGIYVTSPGSGYLDDFDISYYTHPTTPATIVLNSEFDSSGGPCLARYITKPIKLADGYDAGDLRVFLSANKPGSSEISVFFKILSDSDSTPFKDRPYQKLVNINPTVTPSPEDQTYREYEYRPSATSNEVTYTGTTGVTYTSFKTFSIKVVLTSSDPAIVPSVKDLRIIATPAE